LRASFDKTLNAELAEEALRGSLRHEDQSLRRRALAAFELDVRVEDVA
jgi:hypothetical protein